MLTLSSWIMRAVAVYLTLTWAAVLAIDFLRAYDRPRLVWPQFFFEGAPTEWLQWGCLAGCILTTAFLWGRASAAGHAHAGAYAVWAFGFSIMLIEDAGNIRHLVGNKLVGMIADEAGVARTAKTVFELSFYSLLGLLMAWPLLRHGRRLPFQPRALALVATGYAAYALAAASSATRTVGNWYATAGDRLLRPFDIHSSAAWQRFDTQVTAQFDEGPMMHAGYWLMDNLLEETVELIAASTLLAGLLTLGAAQLALSAASRPHAAAPA